MITFVRTRWDYDSYKDFWKLVKLSEFPFVYVDEIDIYDSDKTYILSPMNGELKDFYGDKDPSSRTSKIFLWNLERPSGSGGISNYIRDNQKLIDDMYIDGVIVSDRYLADITKFMYIPLGSHKDFGSPGDIQIKMYDLIHISCYSGNRHWMFDSPGNPKHTLGGMSVATNGWGEFRDMNLKRSRIMLATHQDGFPFIEPLRYAVASAYGLPIISEFCEDHFPYEFGIHMATTFHPIVESARDMLRNYEYWYSEGLRLRDYMTKEYSFRNCLESHFHLTSAWREI